MASLAHVGEMFASLAEKDNSLRFGGRITALTPTQVRISSLQERVQLGDMVRLGDHVLSEVVQIDSSSVLVSPFADVDKLQIGQTAFVEEIDPPWPDETWLGRVFDALGRPMDSAPPPERFFVDDAAKAGRRLGALQRGRVDRPLKTGLRAIDIFTPLCYGQRFGIFAGSGVGKSTLLSMLANSGAFDAVVVAMVGERGREVREFLEDTIGDEGMKKTIAIVATSDENPILRRRAPEFSFKIAESLREQGKDVLLLMDSVTRYAHSLREIGIARGEPPVARGYPASVFNELPKLLERAGPGIDGHGSITAIVTVLVDGDDHNDPVADAVRGIIDGHLVLDRAIAEEGRYPPIDTLASLSRVADRVWSADEKALVLQLRKMIARYEETSDLRLLGGWKPGNDPQLDKAVETVPIIYEALCQSASEPLSTHPFDELVSYLRGDNAENKDTKTAA